MKNFQTSGRLVWMCLRVSRRKMGEKEREENDMAPELFLAGAALEYFIIYLWRQWHGL